MPRQTIAQKIESNNELEALEFFETRLASLVDPRRPQGVRYPLRSVVVIALMAMVCGSDNAESMSLWAKSKESWLAEFLSLPHGVPSQDVFLSVFAALDPEAFSGVFVAWSQWLMLRLGKTPKHIAIDGKTSRRSFDTDQGIASLHTVSAWTSDAGLVLGQCKTDVKSNEIKAIPQLLKTLDIRGAAVTIDAMGCQRDIAQAITKGGGDYWLAVKDNQPTLHREVIETFAQVDDERSRTNDEIERPNVLERPNVQVFEHTEKDHGRVETRRVRVCRNLDWIGSADRWDSLACVVEVTRERHQITKGKTSLQTAYYIGSDATKNAEQIASDIRNHWGIENKLHWVLDMAFREDEARHRAKNTAQNFTTLRHFALNMIKLDKTRKVGIAICRQRAGWDNDYLIQLLTGPTG